MMKTRTIIPSFLARMVMTLLVITAAISSWAVEVGDIVTIGGVKYEITEACRYYPETLESYGKASVVGYDASYPYTNIEIDAFLRLENNPYYVTRISEEALKGWTKMTSLKIWNTTGEIQRGVENIGESAFKGCTGLTSIEIPNSVMSIGENAFSGCTDLTSIDIPNSVITIGWGVFFDCWSLTSVEIPNSVTFIGACAFYNCWSLTSIDIPNSVTIIGWSAFEGCTSLTDIYFDGTETQWGDVTKGDSWKPGATNEHWRCTVTFNANGHGSAPNAQTDLWSNESTATEPDTPTAQGLVCAGWYTDPGCTNKWNFSSPVPRDMTLYAGWETDFQLSDNTAADLTTYDGHKLTVTLKDRTLFKDGNWNTLCLPFTVSDGDAADGIPFTGTPLEGAIVKTLVSSSFADGTLTLNFSDGLASLSAGTPCIVRWERADDYVDDNDHNAYEPVFNSVIVNAADPTDVLTDYITFIGTYSPVSIEGEDHTLLFLSDANTLYYPKSAMTIGCCRAYFGLNGITAGNPDNGINSLVLNFGGDDATGIQEVIIPLDHRRGIEGDDWYTLDGRKVSGKPAIKGIYINNGQKVVIK